MDHAVTSKYLDLYRAVFAEFDFMAFSRDRHHASVPSSISCNPFPLGTIG
jgi:hypothetical protein